MKLFTRLTFFLFGIFFPLFLPSPIFAQEQPQRVVIINQVRGGECCEPGSLETLRSFITTLKQRQLSATFTIRYDALKDQRFISELKKLSSQQQNDQPTYELGIFLEITPTLANESGVEYKGNKEDWYRAQYAYLIGYAPDDRKKIIDQIFSTFKQQFGYYPTTTTAWMIDTDSLNYLSEKYDTTVHQITREQWGTDSYTLSGGPVHYPYLADKDWAFLPTTEPTNSETRRPTLILRQTISDPLRNYGDSTSAFTSQPNDYMIDQKTTDYFKKLLLQSLAQPANQYSFALIGLENSMRETVNQEYLRQLEFVSTLVNERPHLQVQTAQQFNEEYRQSWQDQTITAVQGKDLIDQTSDQTIWINTSHYRIRLLQKGNTFAMTDFRFFQPTDAQLLSDPYNSLIAQQHGYWVTPFMIDGSRFYLTNEGAQLSRLQQLKEKIKEKILPEYTFREQVFLPVQNDLATQPMSLQLPDVQPNSLQLRNDGEATPPTVQYTDKDGHPVTLTFLDNEVLISAEQIDRSLSFHSSTKHTPFLTYAKKNDMSEIRWIDESTQTALFTLEAQCDEKNKCRLIPLISDQLSWTEVQKKYYPFLFPDLSLQQFSAESSVVYAHNRVALAGQNPIRLVLLPRDKNGYPVKQPEQIRVTVEPSVSDIITQSQHGQSGTTFIDLIENRAGRYQVKVKVADENIYDQEILFLPDCQQTLWSCLKQPLFLKGYAEYQFITRLRQL